MRNNIYDLSIWKFRPTKLAILIPCRESMYSLFTSSLVELVKTTTMAGIDVHVLYNQSTILLTQREKLAQQALEIEADYSLWLDSDMLFPSTTAMRLMGHNKDIVCSNYMKRSVPIQSVAYPERGNWDNWLPLEHDENLQEVEGVGMGCMLVKTSVFSNMETPWYEVSWVPEWQEFIGEDFYFCMAARQAGFNVWIDTLLNKKLKHVGVSEFTLQTVDISTK